MTYTIFFSVFFFFNDTATTEIYTLSLHDALPICRCWPVIPDPLSDTVRSVPPAGGPAATDMRPPGDRESTRLKSSHSQKSYAVFRFKKKKKNNKIDTHNTRI